MTEFYFLLNYFCEKVLLLYWMCTKKCVFLRTIFADNIVLMKKDHLSVHRFLKSLFCARQIKFSSQLNILFLFFKDVETASCSTPDCHFFILLTSIQFIPSVTAHSLILIIRSPTTGLTSLMSHSTVIKLHRLNFTVPHIKLYAFRGLAI